MDLRAEKARFTTWIFPVDFQELLEEIYSRESDSPSCDETYDRFLRNDKRSVLCFYWCSLTAFVGTKNI